MSENKIICGRPLETEKPKDKPKEKPKEKPK